MEELANNLTPVAYVAKKMLGGWSVLVVTVAAIIAFFSVANAGILSASRYPLAMSRDRILPEVFGRISRRNIPSFGIWATLALVIIILLAFNPMEIAKLGSMRLFQADGLLESARLHWEEGHAEQARACLAQAKAMIAEMGYHRRDREVEVLEVELVER